MNHFEAVIFDMDGTLLDTEVSPRSSSPLRELAVAARMDLLARCVGAGHHCPRRDPEANGPPGYRHLLRGVAAQFRRGECVTPAR